MATMVAPVGVENRMDSSMPVRAPATERMAEQITTPLKLITTRMADKAGKMIRAEISREPTRFMESTMITAVTTAISRLYSSAFLPVAFVKSSSKVTAKILL